KDGYIQSIFHLSEPNICTRKHQAQVKICIYLRPSGGFHIIYCTSLNTVLDMVTPYKKTTHSP
ncbi:MAG: hypothetical protein Q9N02_00840, partial [Ghiorsea sp.]|nr:hypothetical protein [Ghiorsea sp.]